MSYVDEVLASVQQKNAHEPEFLQAVTEVRESLRVVVEAHGRELQRRLGAKDVAVIAHDQLAKALRRRRSGEQLRIALVSAGDHNSDTAIGNHARTLADTDALRPG